MQIMPRWALLSLFCIAAVVAIGGFHVFQGGAATTQERDAFAQDRDPQKPLPIDFDADRAMKYLTDICHIGPRISGTEGMKKQQQYLKKHFESLKLPVEFQLFTAVQVSKRQPVDMANMIVSWHPEKVRHVILCSHYDTRPIADQEPDRRKWYEPFLSANDGCSGVSMIMELANHLDKLNPQVGVDLVLFDGEEYIFEPTRDKYFFGSEYFAKVYKRDRPIQRTVAAVLLDMVAGKRIQFPVEQNSWQSAEPLVQELWTIAAEQGCAAFQNRLGYAVSDDHLALNHAGIPTVDIIDFDYPHWHRLTDVPANCSADSMRQVARVLSVWLQRAK
jgi:Peptidase family M28